jgi:putative endonuclease
MKLTASFLSQRMPRTKKPAAPAVDPAPKPWHLYVLRCRDGSLYCGITNDLDRRVAQHNAGKAARYTRGRGPAVVVRSWIHESKSAALKAEFAFKKLRRAVKEQTLIA